MSFYDEIDVNDSLGLKGFLIITDNKTGKIILKKHNMILKGAKQILLAKFLDTVANGTFDEAVVKASEKSEMIEHVNLYKDYNLQKFIFFNDGSNSDVSYTDTYSDFETYITSNTSILISLMEGGNSNDDINLTKVSNFTFDTDGDHYVLKISTNITLTGLDSESRSFNSLVSVAENGNEGKILFSRIKFDPIILSTDSTLNLTYYIYF